MTVDTKKAAGRRKVHYETYDDLLADASSLAESAHHTVGNWSLGQILEHLARAFDMAVEESTMRVPWLLRCIVRTFLKSRFLKKTVPAGFKIPKGADVNPSPHTEAAAALEHLRQVVESIRAAPHLQEHPILGALSAEEWEQFNLRHAEMHMSFAVPDAV